MCGICGVAYSNDQQADKNILARMNLALYHRGPDSDGYYTAPGIGFAMRRLAIIDLDTGDQPISNEEENIWLVMNGEIYNHPDLRKDLELKGHTFKTNADTEVILHLYEEHGDDLVQHLRGMFVFALWDQKQQRLLIGRDRLGQKPLYYTTQNGCLYFSSELDSLVKGVPSKPEINLAAIDLYLSFQYIPDPLTVYQNIFKLPPAHILSWKNGTIRKSRYWHLLFEPKLQNKKEEVENILNEKLREAVRIRLLSDVPLGAHLSGGIDSSVIVALMAQMSSQPVKTFSIGFKEQSYSELQYARLISDRYATDHHEFILEFGDIPETIAKITRNFGEPFGDPSALALYHLSKVTRQHVTVALNGDGGDDFFAGYVRYMLDPWANIYRRLPGLLTRRFVPAITQIIPDRSDKPTGHSITNGLNRLGQLAQIDHRASVLRWGSFFSPTHRTELWREEFFDSNQKNNAQNFLVEKFEALAEGGYLDRTLYSDINSYLPGDLLVKADRMTMAASLEGRSPLLDHEWVELVARLPESWKLNMYNSKYIFKKAFGNLLPEEVLRHRKQGFSIPAGAWFRGPLAAWAQHQLLSPESQILDWFNPDFLKKLLEDHTVGRIDNGKRIWALVMLNQWKKYHSL
jgi:asparagine synthase (glutamine-hydrolysing)